MKPIPGYPGLYANDLGQILDEDSKVLTEDNLDNSYNLLNFEYKGKNLSKYKYSLVASAYHEIPVNKDGSCYVVNHINGRKNDDRPSNLQYITNAENVLHGTLLGSRNLRPLIKWFKLNGEQYVLCEDLHHAVLFSGLTYEEVWESIRTKTWIGGDKFEHIPWNDKDVLQTRLALNTDRETFNRPLDVLNLETDEISHYPSMASLADELGIKTTHVRIRVSDKYNVKILHRKYILVDKDYGFDFLDEGLITALKNRGAKPILVYHILTGEETEWESAYKFIKNKKISKNPITERLAKNKFGVYEDWIFCYKGTEGETPFRDKIKSLASS